MIDLDDSNWKDLVIENGREAWVVSFGADGCAPCAQMAPTFAKAAKLTLVEMSPELRRVQAERLKDYDPGFADQLSDIPAGPMILTANEYRTQDQNREAARERLVALLTDALTPPRKRKKSRVNRVGKVKRLKAKKARGDVKAKRGKVDW